MLYWTLLSRTSTEENVVISAQVLNEFVVVITGKVNRPLSIDDAAAILNKFNDNFAIHLTGLPDITKAFSLIKKFKLSYWDALNIER